MNYLQINTKLPPLGNFIPLSANFRQCFNYMEKYDQFSSCMLDRIDGEISKNGTFVYANQENQAAGS